MHNQHPIWYSNVLYWCPLIDPKEDVVVSVAFVVVDAFVVVATVIGVMVVCDVVAVVVVVVVVVVECCGVDIGVGCLCCAPPVFVWVLDVLHSQWWYLMLLLLAVVKFWW